MQRRARPPKKRPEPGQGVGLIVERKLNQSFLVDGPCEVTLLRVGWGYAKLAIKAGPEVKILRSELVH